MIGTSLPLWLIAAALWVRIALAAVSALTRRRRPKAKDRKTREEAARDFAATLYWSGWSLVEIQAAVSKRFPDVDLTCVVTLKDQPTAPAGGPSPRPADES